MSFVVGDRVADLSFNLKLTDEVDKLRRILNSDVYMPGACKRLAERCESMLSHMREHTTHLADVEGLDIYFAPVLALCDQIAKFLIEIQNMSYTARRILQKQELVQQAEYFTERVDDVNCQVMIKLNLLVTTKRSEIIPSRSLSFDSQASSQVYSNSRNNSRKRSTNSASNRVVDYRIMYLIGILVFSCVVIYLYAVPWT